MTITDFLIKRHSNGKLIAPAPSGEQLERIFQSALSTPDHMRLKPWRYLVIQGEALTKLGQVFLNAAEQTVTELSEETRAKYMGMPLRAPMIIVGISKNVDHEKVPVWEQQVSCGVGIQHMLLSIHDQGFGGIWRTGPLAANPVVKEGLGLSEQESIIGFLYVGTPERKTRERRPEDSAKYFSDWN